MDKCTLPLTQLKPARAAAVALGRLLQEWDGVCKHATALRAALRAQVVDLRKASP
jgi:hypothetical protein